MHPPSLSRAVVLALTLALVPALSGCVLGGESLIMAASAPKAASGMTLFVATDGDIGERVASERASYSIFYGDKLIYPPGGKGAEFDVVDRTGNAFVPYSQFVVGNGEYDVVVRYKGDEARVRVPIQKWAEYVFLHPADKGNVIQVEVAISAATGGNPLDRVLTQGDVVLALHYRGLDGSEDRTLGSLTAETTSTRSTTMVELPRSRFTAGPGYYSVEPVFHNREALNNVQVPPDPTMANRSPPWNWVYITA